MGAIVKNAPNALIWAVALCFVAVLGSFVVLASNGSDSTDLRTFVNTVLNIAGALFSGGALIVAGSAARSAGNAERQTNGIHATQAKTIQQYRAENEALRAANRVLQTKDTQGKTEHKE